MPPDYTLRLASEIDIPALELLIPLSARALQHPHYSHAQIEAALGPVFGVDRGLIADGTYYCIEHHGTIVACGGWSRRRAVFGVDRNCTGEDTHLDPTREPARIRAFFVHPDHTRRSLGTALLHASESALQAGGFRQAILVATLTGERLYTAANYTVAERYEVPLPNALTLPVVRMTRDFSPTPSP